MSIHSFFLCPNLQRQIYIFHSVMMNKSQLKSRRGGKPTVWKRGTCLYIFQERTVCFRSVCPCVCVRVHCSPSIIGWSVWLITVQWRERETRTLLASDRVWPCCVNTTAHKASKEKCYLPDTLNTKKCSPQPWQKYGHFVHCWVSLTLTLDTLVWR